MNTAIDGITVIKLGGSLSRQAAFGCWLEAIAAIDSAVALVPGGGPFADAVRRAQSDMGFDDRVAHKLALMAMGQYGEAICNLDQRFSMAAAADDFTRIWRMRGKPVWAPLVMAMACKAIPASWNVTSDSLAAWLAGELKASRLILVKPLQPDAQEMSAASLADRGITDPLFPKFLATAGIQAVWLGPLDWPNLPLAVKGDHKAGARIHYGFEMAN